LLNFETYQLREVFDKYLACKIFLCLISYNFKIKCIGRGKNLLDFEALIARNVRQISSM